MTIESNIRNYDVNFEETFNFLQDLREIIDSIFIIDKNVYNLYRKEIGDIKSDRLFLFDAVEENKTYDFVKKIYDFMISKSVRRNITIISIGGGITQDVTGFAASTLYRGVNWIFVPTTFLAITDSCIGSKTSLNYDKHKNLVGTFFPPAQIYINTDFLNTLEKLDFFSGVGETIKLQLMKEEYPKDISKVLNVISDVINAPEARLGIIRDNMSIKLGYMKGDEFDLGRRNFLNYGHCFGHALETASEYYVPHGIAVNIGMIFANLLSVRKGMLSSENSNYINKKVLLPNIPLKLREQDFSRNLLLESMKNDKKRIGEFLTVIILDVNFKMVKMDDITDAEFDSTLHELKGSLENKGGWGE